jgi:glucose dehydrogenase
MKRSGALFLVLASLLTTGRAQEVGRPGSQGISGNGDWSLHNGDLSNHRFSPLDQINTANVTNLALKWSFPVDNAAPVTPLVVDGVMYFNAGSKLFALDAATGKEIWTTQAVDTKVRRSGRGPAYGGGRIYAALTPEAMLYAVDAKTGKLVEGFGEGGVVHVARSALLFKRPGRYPANVDTVALGYHMTAPPTYFAGTLYMGVATSEGMIEGGLLIAMDATTGAIKWVFTTVPQGPQDEGWTIAEPTWGSGRRVGGGIWAEPAIDPDLGMIYFNAANPAPDYDGSARVGENLFTNSMLALNLTTGKLAWHYQVVHHDIWDKDLTNSAVLFDVNFGGHIVKGVASAGKTCYVYMLNRETGQPINPIVETSVPTTTDVKGEHLWPTQPIPYTAAGVPQQPFCAVYPREQDPELAKRARPQFYPLLSNELVILSPGLFGGANWGSSSFSPRTGFLYVTGKNDAFSLRVKSAGDSVKAGAGAPGHFASFEETGATSVKPTQTVAAYDPFSGEQVWHVELRDGTTLAGNLTTAGDLVFQGLGNGSFFALDARTGKQLFKYSTKTISASPLSYQAKGKQYVSVMAGDRLLTFGLP